jgi:hypothetical protein
MNIKKQFEENINITISNGLPENSVPLIINGHFRILDWRYLPYIRPIFQAYVREYPHKIWPEIWY